LTRAREYQIAPNFASWWAVPPGGRLCPPQRAATCPRLRRQV